MYGQMTAGSWIYIGTQGILQGTYETFIAAAKKHWNKDSLAGKLVLTSGLGGMGGAQPLAVTMADGVIICIEVDIERIKKRIQTKYLDTYTDSIDEAIKLSQNALRDKKPLSIGLLGNAATIIPEFAKRDFIPDLVTDQTSAHDELVGYIPSNYSILEAHKLRNENPKKYVEESVRSMGNHVKGILKLKEMGSIVFDYGNNLRSQAKKAGVKEAYDYPGFVPAYIRPLFCKGMGPFRWVALSGDKEDIYKTDQKIIEMFQKTLHFVNGLEWLKKKYPFKAYLQEYVG